MSLDYTKPGPALLVDLINESNDTIFQPGDLTFSTPLVYSDPAFPGINTRITASGTGTTGFEGPQDLFYSRLDLDYMLGVRDNRYTVPADQPIDLAALLTQLNARCALGITTSDVLLDSTDPISAPTEIILSALVFSLTYIGETTLVLTPA
jgi:hypothetical protein